MLKIIRSDVFDRWLHGLRDRAGRARILARVERMAEGNLGDCKAVGGVMEVRAHAGPGYRLYFIREGDAVIVLLCGGDKSSQQRDIARARKLEEQWRRQ